MLNPKVNMMYPHNIMIMMYQIVNMMYTIMDTRM